VTREEVEEGEMSLQTTMTIITDEGNRMSYTCALD
jgi:hypothetical protein